MRLYLLPVFSVLFFITACSEQSSTQLPPEVEELENITAYSADEQPAYEIRFEREQEFGDTDEVLIERISGIAVDESGRVFMADNGQKTIHVYNPDGSYQTGLGQQGGGPGEFLSVGSILRLSDDRLFAYDQSRKRINIYSLETLSFISAFTQPSDGFLEEFFITGDANFLVGIGSPGVPDEKRPVRYFYLDQTGEMVSEKIFEQQQSSIFQYKGEESSVTMILPFRPEPLVAVSDNNEIYAARTNLFLIRIHDENGEYQRAFYYPYENTPLNRTEYIAGFSEMSPAFQEAAKSIDYPETWPALSDIFTDDQNRLWISTIVEDDEIYEWWVLEDTGELLARFDWPRDKEIEVIKNGRFYTIETEEETGLEEVVRYRIEMSN